MFDQFLRPTPFECNHRLTIDVKTRSLLKRFLGTIKLPTSTKSKQMTFFSPRNNQHMQLPRSFRKCRKNRIKLKIITLAAFEERAEILEFTRVWEQFSTSSDLSVFRHG